ncbi:MAG: Uncharacterised protein [Euryarchaeota archaeon UBA443]|nr:MAG: Uncharacterised protein [Euryarchaeota archaeon UBA443]
MVTQQLTTSHYPDLTLLERSVSLIGTEPTVPRRPTGSALVPTVSTTSTARLARTHDVPLDTTMHTTPTTDGVGLLLVQVIMDAWLPLVQPPTR